MSTRESQRSNASASANVSRRTSRNLTQDRGGPNVAGTGISFTATDTIADSGNALAVFGVGEMIEIRGAASNSRVFRVVTSAAGTLTVLPALVANESAGASMRILAA